MMEPAALGIARRVLPSRTSRRSGPAPRVFHSLSFVLSSSLPVSNGSAPIVWPYASTSKLQDVAEDLRRAVPLDVGKNKRSEEMTLSQKSSRENRPKEGSSTLSQRMTSSLRPLRYGTLSQPNPRQQSAPRLGRFLSIASGAESRKFNKKGEVAHFVRPKEFGRLGTPQPASTGQNARTKVDPVELLSQIRPSRMVNENARDNKVPRKDIPKHSFEGQESEELSTEGTSNFNKNHNTAFSNLRRGIRSRDFVLAFNKGWKPIQDLQTAGRVPVDDLVHLLQLATFEMGRSHGSRAAWEDVRVLVLFLAAEERMPGLMTWVEDNLRRGLDGAKCIVDIWESMVRKEHIALRQGEGAIDRYDIDQKLRRHVVPRTEDSYSTPSPWFYALYIAAKSVLHTDAELSTLAKGEGESIVVRFAEQLPTLLQSNKVVLSTALSKASWRRDIAACFSDLSWQQFNKGSTEARDLTIRKAEAWLRQTLLAEKFYQYPESNHSEDGQESFMKGSDGQVESLQIKRLRSNPLKIAGEISWAFRIGQTRKLEDLWESIKEGFDGGEFDVGWMQDKWQESHDMRWVAGSDGLRMELNPKRTSVKRGTANLDDSESLDLQEIEADASNTSQINEHTIGSQREKILLDVDQSAAVLEVGSNTNSVKDTEGMSLNHEVPLALEPTYLTQALVAIFLHGFTKMLKYEEANAVWTWMSSRSMKPGVVAWEALLSGYSDSAAFEPAMSVWTQMKDAGVVPDVWCWIDYASAHYFAKRHTDAWHIIQTMLQTPPVRRAVSKDENEGMLGIVVYNKLIGLVLRQGFYDEAFDLLERMQKEGFTPVIHTYNLFIRFHVQPTKYQSRQRRDSRPQMDEVAKFLRYMAQQKCEPDTITYTMILQCLLSSGGESREAASKTMAIMDKMGVKPDQYTYGSIIHHLCKTDEIRELQAALAMIDEMNAAGKKANEFHYTPIIQGFLRAATKDSTSSNPTYKKNEGELHPYFKSALVLKKKMESAGVFLNLVGYHALMGTAFDLRTAFGLELGLTLLSEIRAREGERSMMTSATSVPKSGQVNRTSRTGGVLNYTWFLVLSRLSELGEWELANQVVNSMEKDGGKLDLNNVGSKRWDRDVDYRLGALIERVRRNASGSYVE